MSSTEYKPPAGFDITALQQVWSPQDHRDTVRDVMQLAALKRVYRNVTEPMTVFDGLVVERALLGTLPKPVGSLAPIENLLAGWPAPIVCGVIVP